MRFGERGRDKALITFLAVLMDDDVRIAKALKML